MIGYRIEYKFGRTAHTAARPHTHTPQFLQIKFHGALIRLHMFNAYTPFGALLWTLIGTIMQHCSDVTFPWSSTWNSDINQNFFFRNLQIEALWCVLISLIRYSCAELKHQQPLSENYDDHKLNTTMNVSVSRTSLVGLRPSYGLRQLRCLDCVLQVVLVSWMILGL